MARTSKAQQLFDELLHRYGRSIAEAFLAGVDDLRSQADLQRAISAIQAGNIDAAIEAMHLNAAAFNGLLDAIQTAYTAGGNSAVDAMPALKSVAGQAVAIRFDGRNLRAEAWLKNESGKLVTRIIDDQRVALRQAMVAGMQRGAAPRSVALEIVGRINKATGKREGGILGLSSVQEDYARSAAAELASGDPKLMRNYLARTRRDKRFDRTVQKAIDAKQPVAAEMAGKAVQQYRNRLLQLRGETIGYTEALTSLHAAQHEAYDQAIDTGAVSASQVRDTWRDAGDLRVRHTHTVLNGETISHGEAFTSPSGAMMRFPGDTSLGAPASEIVGCRCRIQKRIDFLANLT